MSKHSLSIATWQLVAKAVGMSNVAMPLNEKESPRTFVVKE